MGSLGEPPSWPDTLQLLTEKLAADNLPHQVVTCKSLEGKVEKVLDSLVVSKRISGWLSVIGERKYGKSGAVSDKLREQGNIKFGAGDNGAALKLYTESVICAPSGPGLGLALGNRSAALYHLGHHTLALADIALALENKFPRSLEYKLHLRAAQCRLRLGQYEECQQRLQQCGEALEGAKLVENKKTAVTKDISALSNEALRLQTRRKQEQNGDYCDSEEFREHSEIQGASEKLRLETSGDKTRGRYLTAAQAVKEGEILFQETPFSCVLLPPFYSSHCHDCLAPLVAPVPCSVCTQPRYCSAECRDQAWASYHQHECGHLDTLHSVGIGHLAVRTVLVAGRDHLMSLRASLRAGGPPTSSRDPYSRVLLLQHHLDRMPAEEQLQYTLTAALLVTLLAKFTSFLSPEREIPGLPGRLKPYTEVPDASVHLLGSLLLRHMVQLVTNAHAVTELLEDEEAGSVEQVRLATGIFPAASLMNHSCVPLIVNSFRGRQLTVRSLRPLEAGAEVTNCYGPHHRRHEYSERQGMLRDQYGFRCRCQACSDLKDRKYLCRFTALRCIKCNGAVVDKKCLDCGEVSLQSNIDPINTAKMQTSDIKKLRQLETSWSRALYKHHEELAALRDKIAKLEVDRGSVREAAMMLESGLEYTEVRYGEDSIEAGHELLKYTDVLLAVLQSGQEEAHTRKRLRDSLKQAQRIFTLQTGKHSKTVKEIKEKLKYLS